MRFSEFAPDQGILARVFATSVSRKMCVNAVLVLAVVVVLGACSSKSKSGSQKTRHNLIHPTGTLVGVGPSLATKMICETEAKKDIAQSGVGFDTIEPLRSAWDKASRIYSYDYVYAGGAKMSLSVKETSSAAATTAYFDSLAERLGKARRLFGTGDGAYTTIGGDMVVRTDYKVLLVDVSRLPPRFGKPADTRDSIATNVAVIIMGCWGSSGVIG